MEANTDEDDIAVVLMVAVVANFRKYNALCFHAKVGTERTSTVPFAPREIECSPTAFVHQKPTRTAPDNRFGVFEI